MNCLVASCGFIWRRKFCFTAIQKSCNSCVCFPYVYINAPHQVEALKGTSSVCPQPRTTIPSPGSARIPHSRPADLTSVEMQCRPARRRHRRRRRRRRETCISAAEVSCNVCVYNGRAYWCLVRLERRLLHITVHCVTMSAPTAVKVYASYDRAVLCIRYIKQAVYTTFEKSTRRCEKIFDILCHRSRQSTKRSWAPWNRSAFKMLRTNVYSSDWWDENLSTTHSLNHTNNWANIELALRAPRGFYKFGNYSPKK